MKILLLLLPLLAMSCSIIAPEQPVECPVHHLSLERELSVDQSGAPRLEYEKAHDELFPYSGTRFSDTAGFQNQYSQVLVCPECRREEQKWIHDNRWK